jgi:UDPglucose--hexose-1-phosphate uridylyltransferase
MSELRLNLITGEWVIIATERAKRPEEFKATAVRRVLPPFSESCPFCPGHEDRTPPETLRIPDDGSWLRAVPNKFSALSPEGDLSRYDAASRPASRGRLPRGDRREPGARRDHGAAAGRPGRAGAGCVPRPAARVLSRVGGRARHHFQESARPRHLLEHSHCQIVGMPASRQLRRRIERRCASQRLRQLPVLPHLADELTERVRVVTENASFVAFVPYAALSPFHLWITPRRHAAHFGAVGDSELADLAAILRDVLRRLHFGLGDPDFNWVIRSLSPEESAVKYFHWYLSLVPRVSRAAGFELGTGMFINTALPEASAAFLRSVDVGGDRAAGL